MKLGYFLQSLADVVYTLEKLGTEEFTKNDFYDIVGDNWSDRYKFFGGRYGKYHALEWLYENNFLTRRESEHWTEKKTWVTGWGSHRTEKTAEVDMFKYLYKVNPIVLETLKGPVSALEVA